ncbi:MAG: efflux transporter periplasmic adaptor subunit [Gammaproteobacteria bacterium]|nr:MAG: efflux transporter periplasmic adaptor subunit [Gammaproteobacteria bacterium]
MLQESKPTFSACGGSSPVRRLLLVLGLVAMLSGVSNAADVNVRPTSIAAEEGVLHDCLIEPNVVTQVGSSTQGVIERLLVDRGDEVRKGQPLAELVSDIERLSVEQARARATMTSDIAAREADLALATHNLKRIVKLQSQSLVPRQQRDEAFARQQVADAALVQARDTHELARLELARVEEQLSQRTISSPVDGVVVELLRFPGEFVYDKPVLTVAEIDPLRVEVILPGSAFGRVRVGDVASVYPEFGSGDPVSAVVDVVDPLLDTRSGTFGIRLTLPNTDRAIVAGQQCRVSFGATVEHAAADD